MDSYYLMENLPYFFIIIFLIITVTILLIDRSNLLEISEKQNSLKEKINDINIPECPRCPEQKECPSFTCPEQKECPDLTCPEVPSCPEAPGCPKCPDHPEMPTFPECPKCKENGECPECPENQVCPDCPDCPKCPDCPQLPNNNGMLPSTQRGNVLSGSYTPADQFSTTRMNMQNSNNNMSGPRPVMESIPGFLPYADDSYTSANYFPISQMGLATDSNASGVNSGLSTFSSDDDASMEVSASDLQSVSSSMNTTQMESLGSPDPASPSVSEPSSPTTDMN